MATLDALQQSNELYSQAFLGKVLLDAGCRIDGAEGDRLLRRCVTHYDTFIPHYRPRNPQRIRDVRYERAMACANLGRRCSQSQSFTEADGWFARALAEMEVLVADSPDDTYATLAKQCGDNLITLGRTEEAVNVWNKSIDLCERAAAKHPDDGAIQRAVARAHFQIGRALIEMGDLAGGEAVLQSNVNELRESLQLKSRDSRLLDPLFKSADALATALSNTPERKSEADALAEEAILAAAQLARIEPNNPGWPWWLTATHADVGNGACMNRGDHARAMDRYRLAFFYYQQMSPLVSTEEERNKYNASSSLMRIAEGASLSPLQYRDPALARAAVDALFRDYASTLEYSEALLCEAATLCAEKRWPEAAIALMLCEPADKTKDEMDIVEVQRQYLLSAAYFNLGDYDAACGCWAEAERESTTVKAAYADGKAGWDRDAVHGCFRRAREAAAAELFQE